VIGRLHVGVPASARFWAAAGAGTMKNRRTTACANSTIGFSPMSDCIASTEFTIRKVEPSSNRDRRFRPPCLRCGLRF